MNRLDEAAFRDVFVDPMRRVGGEEEPPFDFWTYFEQIPANDFKGFDCSEGQVNWVWRTADGKFEHVLISAKESTDAFMAIVLDRSAGSVVGHRLLNLREEYGVR